VTFIVDNVSDIKWQEDAFDQLIIPTRQKNLIRALVETHRSSDSRINAFDDFIAGKGKGLVINLFGPPGVGKTLSAEATSECEFHKMGFWR
jgi:ATP-dependent Lon protease